MQGITDDYMQQMLMKIKDYTLNAIEIRIECATGKGKESCLGTWPQQFQIAV